MEIFRVARRSRPRRLSRIETYETLPAPVSQLITARRPGRRAILLFAGILSTVVALAVLAPPLQEEGTVGSHPRSKAGGRPGPGGKSPGSAAPGTQAGPGSLGGGGTGGIARASADPILPLKATDDVYKKATQVVFNLRKDPSTHQNMTDRMALFEKVFMSLDVSDRQAIFGVAEFKPLETAIRAQGQNAPKVLDKFLNQLQIVLF